MVKRVLSLSSIFEKEQPYKESNYSENIEVYYGGFFGHLAFANGIIVRGKYALKNKNINNIT